MAKKRRYVDIVSTQIITPEDSRIAPPSFKDILQFINGKEYPYGEKIFELTLLDSDDDNCVIGLIVTTQDKDIPPKRDKRTKEYSQLSLNPVTEGLAYANIFLYDIPRNILIYEINKNSCFIAQFKEFIYSHWNSEMDSRFNISFPVVVKRNEYDRMLRMDRYQKIVVELYKPSELLQCYAENSESMEDMIIDYNIKIGNQNNADYIKIEHLSLSKKINPLGLSRSATVGLFDSIKANIMDMGFTKNIKTLEVVGYTQDFENGKKMLPINLLHDTYNESFKISSIRVQSDVQANERKEGIIALYQRLLQLFP